jgi:hypothetical protein
MNSSQRHVGLLFALLILTGTTFCFAAEPVATENLQGQTAPIAHFAETEYHFDSVADGAQVIHGFTIQNQGMAELNIKQVKTG